MTKTVLILFGGQSSEHEVSIRSARTVTEGAIQAGYKIVLCYVSKNGLWSIVNDFDSLGDGMEIVLAPGRAVLLTRTGQAIEFDVIFPVIHGRGGEDGSIQGLAQYLNAPVVGCGIQASVNALDKSLSKQLVQAQVPVVPGMTVSKDSLQDGDLYRKMSSWLGEDLFIKPNDQGSSVGAHKVSTFDEYRVALKDAFSYTDSVLIEKALDHPREIELAVLEQNGVIRVSGAGEIRPGDDFYSYDDKYSDDSKSKAIIPADIPYNLVEKLQDYAKTVFTTLSCKGLARVDFFLDKDGSMYFNEINTMPGFTSISMYPKLWEAEGVSISELAKVLVDEAATE